MGKFGPIYSLPLKNMSIFPWSIQKSVIGRKNQMSDLTLMSFKLLDQLKTVGIEDQNVVCSETDG